MTKRISDKWRGAYSDKLEKSEKREVARFKKYLKSQYNEGVDSFLATSSEGGFASLFKLTDLKDLYVDLYTNIGTDFAVWYQKNYEKFITKNTTNPDTWSTEFERYGETQAGEKIAIVQGSAKKELRKNIKNLFKDEEFQRLGRLEQSRILKSRFNTVSDYQALRIVRTEATSAANEGIMRSATDLFPKGVLMKEWVSGTDSRVRRIANKDKADHAVMNNHPAIPYDELFQVPTVRGVERMSRPADSTHGASAYNIINCRCSIAVYPIEGADVREGVVLDGIGGDFSAAATRLVGDEIVTARKPTREIVEDVEINPAESLSFKNRKEAENYLRDKLGVKYTDFQGVDIETITEYVKGLQRIKDVFPDYQLNNLSGIKGFRSQIVDEISSKVFSSKRFLESIEGYSDSYVKRAQNRVKSMIKKNLGIAKINSGTVASYHSFTDDFVWSYYGVRYDLRKYDGIVHKFKGNFDEMVKVGTELEENKWWSKGSSKGARHTLLHEIGHGLHFETNFHESDEIIKLYERLKSKGSNYRQGRYYVNTHIEEELSSYGSINVKEFIAESVAEYFTSDNPRPLSIKVVEILIRHREKNLKKYLKMNKESKKNKQKESEKYEMTKIDFFESYGGVHKPTDEYVEPQNPYK